MKINLTAPILDEKDQPIEGMTLGSVAAMACFAPLKNDESSSATKKGELGFLGYQCGRLDEINLKTEQVSMIKERIAQTHTNLVVWRVNEIIDPPEVEKPAKPLANGSAEAHA